MERYLGPKQQGGRVVKVLLADGSVERTKHFRMEGEGYHFRIVRSAADLERSLKEEWGKWDLVLHAIYLGNWQDPTCHTVPMLVEAFHKGKIRGVLCVSSIDKDAVEFTTALRAEGVPCKAYPFSYARPGDHVELVVDAPLKPKETLNG